MQGGQGCPAFGSLSDMSDVRGPPRTSAASAVRQAVCLSLRLYRLLGAVRPAVRLHHLP
jgi:hypothetical protein